MKRERFRNCCYVLLGCLFIAQQTWANNAPYEHRRDSLLRVISLQSGEEKLKSYVRLVRMASHNGASVDVLRYYYEQGYTAALAQGSDLWTDMAVEYLVALYNRSQWAEVQRVGEPLLQKMPKDYKYFHAATLIILSYKEEHTRKQQQEAMDKLYREAQQLHSVVGICCSLRMMTLFYYQDRNYNEAMRCVRECLTYALKSGDTIDFQMFAYNYLCDLLINHSEHPEQADPLFIRWEKVLKTFEEKRGIAPDYRFSLYRLKAAREIQLGQYDAAWKYVQQYTTLLPALMGQYNFYVDNGRVAEGHRKYKEALASLDKADSIADKYGSDDDKITVLSYKLHVLAKMGNRDEDVYHVSQQLLALKDSIIQEGREEQLNELNTQYGVEKLSYEKMLAHKRFIFTLCICALLALSVAMLIYYNRRMSKKDRILYDRLHEYDLIGSRQHDPADIVSPIPNNPQQQLVDNLNKYLLTDKHYSTLSNMEDEEMLIALQTNRTYLRDAVRNVTGKTLSEYVHDLQLEEARHLLDNRPELTIDSIAMECGFSSRTFSRLFHNKFDISPSQYRKMKV
ncbi:MAG: helix-turn-helix domain-containing protein [Mediterranea sp.]|jgi:AraC-like DNA-binding protein|nr:helix-turn-helix domain-containing protein [Mediterranea sp.]